jgi:hypothetical protein
LGLSKSLIGVTETGSIIGIYVITSKVKIKEVWQTS